MPNGELIRSGAFEALGERFRLLVPPELADVLVPALADLASVEGTAISVLAVVPRGAGFFDVTWNDEIEAEGVNIALALYQVLISINVRAAAAAAVTDTVLHAGVLEVTGVGIALVGPSGAGKTTLTAGGALLGLGYVADEICAINSTGRIRPYHRPPGLRSGGANAIGVAIPDDPMYQWMYPLRMGDRVRLAGDVPLACVVLVDRRSGPTVLERLGKADALVALANQTLGASGSEQQMFQRLAQLVNDIPIARLGFATTESAIERLHQLVNELNVSTRDWV